MPSADTTAPPRVLHRRPGFWSLSAKLVEPWTGKSGGQSKELNHSSIPEDESSNRFLEERVIEDEDSPLDDSLDDVSPQLESVSPNTPAVAKPLSLLIPSSSPQIRSPANTPGTMITTPATQVSVEWETETLLEKNNAVGMEMHHSPELSCSYPCPFRKRNPVRFNVRDHEACARGPFASIAEVRHHILSHHRRLSGIYVCRRCKSRFLSPKDLEAHLMLPRDQICDVDPSPFDDPEDGVGQDALRILSAKDDDLQVPWTWESIWTTLFPDDDDVPDPDFQPVIELDEVQQAFDDELDTLKESLCEKLELLVPGVGDQNYLSFLAGQLGLVFDTHRANIMKQCRNRVSGTKGGRIPESRTPTPALGLGLMLDAQSQEQQQKQPSKPPMKLNRRSRRSTLLQALHSRNSTQQSIQQTSPSEPRRSPGPMFRQSSPNPRRPSRDLSRSSLFITRRTSATTGTSSRTTTPSFPILPISVRPSGSVRGSPQYEKAANRYPTPETTPNQAEKRQQHQTCRELRDSGISVSGDVCDAEEGAEACICRAKLAQQEESETNSTDTRERQPDEPVYSEHRFSSSSTRLERQREELHIAGNTPVQGLGQLDLQTNPATANVNPYIHDHSTTTIPTTAPTVPVPAAVPQLRTTVSSRYADVRDVGPEQEPRGMVDTFIPVDPLSGKQDIDDTNPLPLPIKEQFAAGGDRFSPQSFAQRVLRSQREKQQHQPQQHLSPGL